MELKVRVQHDKYDTTEVVDTIPGANSITLTRRMAVSILKGYDTFNYSIDINRDGVYVGSVGQMGGKWVYASHTKSGDLLYRLYPFGNIDKKPFWKDK